MKRIIITVLVGIALSVSAISVSTKEPCTPSQEMSDAILELAEKFQSLPDTENQSVAALLFGIMGSYSDCTARDLLNYTAPFYKAHLDAIERYKRSHRPAQRRDEMEFEFGSIYFDPHTVGFRMVRRIDSHYDTGTYLEVSESHLDWADAAIEGLGRGTEFLRLAEARRLRLPLTKEEVAEFDGKNWKVKASILAEAQAAGVSPAKRSKGA